MPEPRLPWTPLREDLRLTTLSLTTTSLASPHQSKTPSLAQASPTHCFSGRREPFRTMERIRSSCLSEGDDDHFHPPQASSGRGLRACPRAQRRMPLLHLLLD